VTAQPAAATFDQIDNEEWVNYLTDVLKRLDTLATPLPKDSALRQFVDDASETLGILLGYFVGGIENQ
jgi:hypothetical protein